MRTIGRKRDPRSPRGDVERLCGYCGVAYLRSELRRDASGILACPDELPGLDVVTLSEGNAELASQKRMGNFEAPSDGSIDSRNTVPSPGFVNPNGPPATILNLSPIGVLSVQTKLWLRGDVVTLGTGTGVSTWNDQSNSGNSPRAATVAAQPVWAVSDATLSGLPTVTGDGVNSVLQLTSAGSGPLWFWLIAKQVTYTAPGSIFNWGFGLRQQNVSPELRLRTNGVPTVNAAAPVGAWFRAIGSCNIATADTLQLHGTTVSDASAGQRTSTVLNVFSDALGGARCNVAIAELLITTPAPSAAELAAIEAYGLARYGSAVF